MDVKVNEIAVNIPSEVFTWGQFLDWLETNYLDNAQCITKVLLDGREEINYRSSSLCGQMLKTVNSVDVESREFDNVVRESLDELALELNETLALAAKTAHCFSDRDEMRGYPQLSQLLNSTRVLFSIMCEDLGWTDSEEAQIPMRDLPSRLAGALTQLVAAQESRFGLAVSDVIEFEIIPALKSWECIVRKTRSSLK